MERQLNRFLRALDIQPHSVEADLFIWAICTLALLFVFAAFAGVVHLWARRNEAVIEATRIKVEAQHLAWDDALRMP